MDELKKASEYFGKNDLEKALDIVDILIGSGSLFPDSYIMCLILRSQIMVKSGNDIKKSFELVLEAETIAIVEDNISLIIDSKLAVIENLEYQNKLSSIPEKLKEVEDLIASLNSTENAKSEKIANYNKIKSKFSSLIKEN